MASRMQPWHLPGLRERDNSLKFPLAALGMGQHVLCIATVTTPAGLWLHFQRRVNSLW